MAKGKKKTGGKKAIMNVEALRKELAKKVDDNIVSESAGNFISTRGRRFTFKGDVLDDPLNVIVLDYAQDFAFFDRAFDPDNPHPPACFALGVCRVEDLMPHEKAPVPQSEACLGCPNNEFGSGTGKGKACKNQWRLAVVASDDVSGDIAMLRISPVGYRPWEGYVKSLERKYGLPPSGVYTELAFDDNQPDFPVVSASFMEQIQDAEVLSIVIERQQEARELLLEPNYAVDQYEPPSKKKPKATSKKKSAPRRRR